MASGTLLIARVAVRVCLCFLFYFFLSSGTLLIARVAVSVCLFFFSFECWCLHFVSIERVLRGVLVFFFFYAVGGFGHSPRRPIFMALLSDF